MTDALGDGTVTQITDARVIPIDAGATDSTPADAIAIDAPVDAGIDALVAVDAAIPADATQPDAAIPDAMPDADLA